jgi:hypothetical protein
MKKLNGYKVCYRESCTNSEQGGKRFVRYFLTYTRKQAVQAKDYYIRFPPRERGTGRVLIKPKWKIFPLNSKEIQAGIWTEPPF